MDGFILQELTTIQAGTGVTTVTQAEGEWLDLAPYQDAVFWIDVRSGGAILSLQTSPTKDDVLFATMASTSLVVSSLPSILAVFMTAAPCPLARYVRWQIGGTPGWNVTFRIAVAAHTPAALSSPPVAGG